MDWIKKNIIRVLIIALISLGLGWALWQANHYFEQYLRDVAIQQLKDSLHKEIEIQRVSQILGFEFVLKGISVKESTGQKIASVKEVVVFYNPLNLLLQLTGFANISNPIWIYVKEPVADLSAFSQAPLPTNGDKNKQIQPFLPFTSMNITVNQGRFSYQAKIQDRPVRIDLQRVAGSMDYSFTKGSKMNWVAYMGKSRITLKANVKDPSFSSWDARLNLAQGDLSFWGPFLVDPKELTVTQGEMDLSLAIKVENGKIQDPDGSASISKAFLRFPALPSPVENLSSRITVKNNRVEIEKLTASYDKNSIRGSGTVTLDPIPKIRGTLMAETIDLQTLNKLIPQLSPAQIKGKAKVTAELSGLLNRPDIALEFQSKDISVQNYAFDNFRARGVYRNQEFLVDEIEGHTAQGKILGKGLFRWKETENYFSLSLQLNQLQVFPLMQKLYPRLNPRTVKGKVTGYMNASGSLEHFSGESRLTLQEGEWRSIPIQRGEIDLVFNEKGLVLNSMALERGESRILISGNITPAAYIEGNLLVENLPLQEIQDLLPEGFPVASGILFTDTSFYGPFPDTPEKWALWEARGSIRLTDGTIGPQHLSEASATYLSEKGVIKISSARLRENRSELKGEGSIHPSEKFENSRAALQFSSDYLNLKDLRFLSEYVTDLSGEGRLEGQLEGEFLDPRITLQGELSPFSVGGIQAQKVQGNLRWQKNKLTFLRTAVTLNGGMLNYSGSVDFSGESPLLDINGEIREVRLSKIMKSPTFIRTLDTLEITKKRVPATMQEKTFPPLVIKQILETDRKNILPFLEDWVKTNPPPSRKGISEQIRPFLELDGLLESKFSAQGTVAAPDIQVSGTILQGRWKQETFDELTFNLAYRDENTVIQQMTLRKGGGEASFNGVYTLKGKTEIQGKVKNLSVGLIKPLLPPQVREISGNTNGTLLMAGTGATLRYSGDLTIAPLTLNRISFDEANFKFYSTDQVLTLQQVQIRKGSDISAISGEIPYSKDGPLRLQATLLNDVLGLFPSLSGDLNWNGGKGRLELQVKGSREAPEVQGTLKIQEGVLTVSGLPNGLKNLSIAAEIHYPVIELTQFTATSGSGKVTASGKLLLEDLSVKESDIAIFFKDLLVNNPQYVGLAEGDLRFSRKNGKNRLTGKMILTNGDIPVVLTPPPVVPPPFPIDINWNIALREGGVNLIGQDMTIKAGGQLLLTGPIELPVMQGEIRMLQGRAVLFNNEFRILKGKAEYLPSYGYDPYVDVEALTRISNLSYNSTDPRTPDEEKKYPYYEIKAFIRGRSSNYLFDFEVDYPKPAPIFLTKDRILRLLSPAQALEQPVGQGVLSYEAQRYAATALRLQALRKFEASVESALGLESFQVNLDPSQEYTNIRLSVTKKVGERLYLNYEPIFGGTQSQARYSFGIRYNLTDDLSLFGQTLQDNNVVTNRSEDKGGIEMNFPIR